MFIGFGVLLCIMYINTIEVYTAYIAMYDVYEYN